MASVPQQNPYRCDQCGTPNIVAVPLLYQEGTRNYSTGIVRGSSQSYSAQLSAPPRPRGYIRPLLLWGVPTFLFFLWSYAGLGAILERLQVRGATPEEVSIFLCLGLMSLCGLVSNLSRIFRYNREVYPQAHRDWEHTYMCRRCGKFLVIPW
jgi:hypothetical protein